MRTTRRAATVGAMALLLGAAIQAGPVAAAPQRAVVKCGTVITIDTTLTADVGPCVGGGLVVGADNVTLDLGGRVVLGRANRTGDGVGIRITGRSGVTVRNGRVTDFDAGVAIEAGSANTVTGLLVKDNIGTTKRGDFGDGIAVSSSSGNRITGNNVIHNGPFDGIGLFGPSSGNLLEDNLVSENNVPLTGEDGIRIEGPGATGNTVRGNRVTGSTLDGIAVFSNQGTGPLNSGNLIDGNTVTANGFGFLGARPGDGIRTFLRANETKITNNFVHDNAGSGILIGRGSLSNDILGNTSTGNAIQAAAGTRFDLHDLNVDPPCDANVWTGNVYGTANQVCTTV